MTKKFEYDYPMPALTVDIVFVAAQPFDYFGQILYPHDDMNVLLIKRKNEPWKDCWALPGGFMEIDETLDRAAQRELAEETGIKIPKEKLHFSSFSDDPSRDPRGRIVSAVFLALAKFTPEVKAGDDASEYMWVRFFDIRHDFVQIAFDHREAIMDAFCHIAHLSKEELVENNV